MYGRAWFRRWHKERGWLISSVASEWNIPKDQRTNHEHELILGRHSNTYLQHHTTPMQDSCVNANIFPSDPNSTEQAAMRLRMVQQKT